MITTSASPILLQIGLADTTVRCYSVPKDDQEELVKVVVCVKAQEIAVELVGADDNPAKSLELAVGIIYENHVEGVDKYAPTTLTRRELLESLEQLMRQFEITVVNNRQQPYYIRNGKAIERDYIRPLEKIPGYLAIHRVFDKGEYTDKVNYCSHTGEGPQCEFVYPRGSYYDPLMTIDDVVDELFDWVRKEFHSVLENTQ